MKSDPCLAASAAFFLFSLLLTHPASAQVNNPAVSDTIPRFESIAPQPLPEDTGEVDRVKPPPSSEVTDDTELIKELKGLWFTSRKEEILAAGRKQPLGVTVSALPLLDVPEVRQKLGSRIGGPVSLKRLNELVKEIVAIYRDHDLPVVDVLIPEQDITTGLVQILVLEGRVEDVRSEGNRWFSDRRITGPVRLTRGGRILSRPLVEDIQLLNRNPFREVEVLFTPGEGPGMTDVVLKTQDRFPVRFYTGYEDTGNDITAEERLIFGFNWGNAFGLDHTFNYQYSISPDLLASRSHALSYEIPVFRDHRLTGYMSYSQASADVTGAGVPGLETDGTSFQSGFRYRHQLPGSQGNFRHALTTGLDQRRVDNDLFSGSLTLNAEQTEIFQAVAGYGMDWTDPTGGFLRFEMTGFFSPGGVGNFNSPQAFEKSRAFSDPSYTYVRFQAERRQPLFWGFEAQARINSQLADTNLLSTEQLGIGGYSSVRGYAESEIRGDEGWYINLELYTPPVKFDRIFDWTGHAAELRFLGFWDYGQVGNVKLLEDENPDGELSSAGGGLRLFIDRYFSARMDYGFQLLDSGFNKRFDSRIHLGLIFSY
ncbi:MAG: ShlB/FhaC/HecB family hemolysin secretion/activation protein [Candidatus Methylacidiphilales bacterium]|nr:ShlB/FhaC/HecB family hemolysin secretion/activation protein [Candidatus Methylacidiphilales bacterium]